MKLEREDAVLKELPHVQPAWTEPPGLTRQQEGFTGLLGGKEGVGQHSASK